MGKIKNFFNKLPKWRTPQPGKSLTMKEWLIYCTGGTGAMGATVFIQFVTLSYGMYIAAALNMNVDHVMYVGLVTSVVTVLTSPLVSFIIDNTNSKYGKFRPYLIWLPIPLVIGYVVLGQLTRIDNYTAMIISFTIVFNIVYFVNRLYTISFNSLVQVMSPSMEERTQLMSIGTFFTSLGPTIVGMLYPMIANFLFSEGKVSGVNSLKSIMIVVPIMAAVFFALGLVCAFSIKERMVLPKKFKQKQGFLDGMKKTVKNKYFWLQNASGILGTFRIIGTTFTTWLILYMIFPQLVESGHGDAANLMQTILVTLIGDACIPGMLLAPWAIKKFGKRKIIIFTSAMSTICTIPMLFINNAYALLAMIYLITFFNGFQIVTAPAVQAEMYDYQQYKTGDRLEGFLSQFGTMISTAVGIGIAFITPAVYKKFGYFGENSVLYDNGILLNIIKTMCGIGVGSGILSIIPWFFYDLSEKKHRKIMDILKIRAYTEDGLCDSDTCKEMELRIENDEKNVPENFYNTINLEIEKSGNESISFDSKISITENNNSEDNITSTQNNDNID